MTQHIVEGNKMCLMLNINKFKVCWVTRKPLQEEKVLIKFYRAPLRHVGLHAVLSQYRLFIFYAINRTSVDAFGFESRINLLQGFIKARN